MISTGLPWPSSYTGMPIDLPSTCNCLIAAGRYTSAATRSGFLFFLLRIQRAILPAKVVLPEPCRPTIMMPTGAGPERLISLVSPPITATSSSWMIFTICWPGVTEVSTSEPMAFSLTAFTKSRVTLKFTSASRNARRTSRSDSATFSSVSLPCPRRFLRVDSRESVSCENIMRQI